MPDETDPTPTENETDPTPAVACTLTADQLADRTGELATLADSYRGAEELADGYTIRFDATDEAFDAVAGFVVAERRCCAFAAYELGTAPPYEETRLTVTGPDGTKTMFGDGFVELLTEIGG